MRSCGAGTRSQAFSGRSDRLACPQLKLADRDQLWPWRQFRTSPPIAIRHVKSFEIAGPNSLMVLELLEFRVGQPAV